jgi:NAD(P)-dependent dehydrogenase (short-subunit alcohol dehydrogenase family)
LRPIGGLSKEQFDQTLAANLKGTWLCLKYEVPAMLKQGGAIVNIASFAGMVGMPGTTIYAAAKAGIIGMTRAAAMEYAKAGLRINVISPGATETGMLDRFTGGDAAAKAQLGASHPIGRAGRRRWPKPWSGWPRRLPRSSPATIWSSTAVTPRNRWRGVPACDQRPRVGETEHTIGWS